MCRNFVMSDIHGYKEYFDRTLEAVGFSCDDRLYVLGDAIDRGPESIQLLQEIMGMENVEMFIGNHELMMMDFIHSREKNLFCGRPDIWMFPSNGGEETKEQLLALPPQEQERIREYLESCWVQKILEISGRKYWLSHSAILPKEVFGTKDIKAGEVSWDDLFHAVWRSPFRLDEHEPAGNYCTDAYTHIIGHVPAARINNGRAPYIFWGEPPFQGSMQIFCLDELEFRYPIVNIDGGCSLIRAKETMIERLEKEAKQAREEGRPDGKEMDDLSQVKNVQAGLCCLQLEPEKDGTHRCLFTTKDSTEERFVFF